MIATTQPIAGPEAYSDEWYALRKFNPDRKQRPLVIGGSDGAACLGVHPYVTPLEFFMRARGDVGPVETNIGMERGHRRERLILDEAAEDLGKQLLFDLPMYFSPRHPFMAITPDSIEASWEEGVDAKSSSHFMRDRSGENPNKYGEEGTDQVPVYCLCQAQQYCEVLNLKRVIFPVMFDSNQPLAYYTVERNDDLIAALIKAETEMVERVINNDPPEPTWEATGTKKLLQELYGFEANKRAELSEEAAAIWSDIARWKLDVDDLNERIEAGKNRVLAEMHGAEIGIFPNGKQGVKRTRIKASTCQVTKAAHERMTAFRVK